MKILIIHNAGSRRLPSGELTVVRNELAALKKAGIESELHIFYNDEIGFRNPLRFLKMGMRAFISYSSYRLVSNLIEQFKPDLVHFHGVLPILTPTAFYACKKKGVPVIQTLHNFRWLCVEGGLFRKKIYCDKCVKNCGWRGVLFGCSRCSRLISFVLFTVNLFYRKTGLLFKWVDYFIAVSEFVKNTYIEAGFPREKIIMKYNGLNLNPTIIKNDSKRDGVAFVGRLTPAKGTMILKEIIRKKDLSFNIIGAGTDLTDLKSYCLTNNFKNVRFWENASREQAQKIIANSLCVIIPSQCGETFSLVAAEAMSNSVPVIVSAIGGPKELIEKSGAGIAVEPRNANAFAQAINYLTDNPEQAALMGGNGKTFVEQELDISKLTEKLIDIYGQVIQNRTKIG